MGNIFFPHCSAGVGRHAPVSSRRKGNGAYLGAVRHAAALELLPEEAADEDAFTAVINAQNEKADVTFVPATAENLALYLTIE